MNEERENKNTVFGGSGPSQQQQHAALQRSVKEDFGYEIPEVAVPLPSSGLVYPTTSPLHGATTVDIKAMGAREEDILTSRSLIKKGTVISALVRSCLLDKRINVDDMLSGDRSAIMVSIRITGYGHEYEVELTCGNCEHKHKHTFDLSRLPINRLNIDSENGGCMQATAGQNLFNFKLPISKLNIQFKFLTGREEQEMISIHEQRKKSNILVDNLISTRLKFSIVSVEGDTDRNKISRFVDNMPAGDSKALRKHIEKHEPGIEMKDRVNCPSCDYESEVAVPLTASFFGWD